MTALLPPHAPVPAAPPLLAEGPLTGPNLIRLIAALSRAKVTRFHEYDWYGWAGAEGDAHMVVFTPEDHRAMLSMLGLDHWDPECVVVIADNNGLVWNGFSEHNSYAWAVDLGVSCTNWNGGTLRELTEADPRRAPPVVLQPKLKLWVYKAGDQWCGVAESVDRKSLERDPRLRSPLESAVVTRARDLYGADKYQLMYGPPPADYGQPVAEPAGAPAA